MANPIGSTFTVVENAGYEGEVDARGGFADLGSAQRWMKRTYGAGEIESLHLLICRDHADGSRTYEF